MFHPVSGIESNGWQVDGGSGGIRTGWLFAFSSLVQVHNIEVEMAGT